jgi:hypothetical protein
MLRGCVTGEMRNWSEGTVSLMLFSTTGPLKLGHTRRDSSRISIPVDEVAYVPLGPASFYGNRYSTARNDAQIVLSSVGDFCWTLVDATREQPDWGVRRMKRLWDELDNSRPVWNVQQRHCHSYRPASVDTSGPPCLVLLLRAARRATTS